MNYVIASSTGGGIGLLLDLVVYVILTIPIYFVFQKAGPYGTPPWAAFIPIWNIIVVLRVAGRPWWWIFLYLLAIIPFLGWIAVLVLGIIVLYDLSRSFGKGGWFTVGLIVPVVNIVCWYVLGFGSARYLGPTGPVKGGTFGSTTFGSQPPSPGYGPPEGYGQGGTPPPPPGGYAPPPSSPGGYAPPPPPPPAGNLPPPPPPGQAPPPPE